MKHPNFDLAEELFISWSKADVAFRLRHVPKAIDKEISFAQFELLHALSFHEQKRTSIKDLAEVTLKSSSAVTQLVASIEEKKFVQRVHSKSDRRVVYVRLTPAGSKKFKELYENLVSSVAEVIDYLDKDEVEQYVKTNNKIAQQI